ncbi:MAG: hypothetical protein IK052_02380 [Bacteroidales bacterium]|nr:hypothetical protein [Bacteroidales bacterium]
MKQCLIIIAMAAAVLCGCRKNNVEPETAREEAPRYVALEDVARIFAGLPIGVEQMGEVHDAALESAANGYDEEYLMKDLFEAPGCGVGDLPSKAREYRKPLRDLLKEAFSTKAEGGAEWLDSLMVSDVQIYWPFSDSWNGSALPVITYDPGDLATSNVGYALKADGTFDKVMVDEEMARERPVWVMNRNSDAEYKSLEMRRREDPSWGNGGGDIIVGPATKAQADIKSLILRSFTAKRQYDSWFAGGAEFFVKVGSVENFKASTEAELKLYNPTITDFMIVVRRKQMGEEIPFNAILISEWTSKLTNCAFMIVEDDGGSRTTWKANAVVKVNSKSYGVELEIPLNSRDDIVWRGSLTRSYIEKYSGEVGHFGDIDLILELI